MCARLSVSITYPYMGALELNKNELIKFVRISRNCTLSERPCVQHLTLHLVLGVMMQSQRCFRNSKRHLKTALLDSARREIIKNIFPFSETDSPMLKTNIVIRCARPTGTRSNADGPGTPLDGVQNGNGCKCDVVTL